MTQAVLHQGDHRSFLPWVWVLSGLYLLVALSAWLPQGYRAMEYDAPFLAYRGARSALECLFFFWVVRRLDLGQRLRQAFRVTACAFGLSAITSLWWLPSLFGLGKPIPAPVAITGTFLTYVLGLGGILWMPTRPEPRGTWWVFFLDLAVAVLGLAAVMALVITVPQMATAPDGMTRFETLSYGGAQTLMVGGLTFLVLRGAALPSKRAFWLFVVMVFLNLLGAIMSQLAASGNSMTHFYALSHLAGALTSVCTLWLVVAFRFDPVATHDLNPAPKWFASFNPLPMLATTGVAVLLVIAVFYPGTWSVRVLASVMVAQVAILLTRLLLTARENSRLMRKEAELEKKRQRENLAVVRRMAGGMAHWYNNLLMAVMARAELGTLTKGLDPAVIGSFQEILKAAERAARLTNQMLSYGGGQFLRPVRFDLVAHQKQLIAKLTSTLPATVTLEFIAEAETLPILADSARLDSAVRELVTNALAAMPAGGKVSIEVRSEIIEAPIDAGPLTVAVGSHAVIAVSDTGEGMAPDQVAQMFDPFFTTQPLHAAAGLGLAEVYGMVAAHGGGLTVRSAPGQGTRIAIYLPSVGIGQETLSGL